MHSSIYWTTASPSMTWSQVQFDRKPCSRCCCVVFMMKHMRYIELFAEVATLKNWFSWNCIYKVYILLVRSRIRLFLWLMMLSGICSFFISSYFLLFGNTYKHFNKPLQVFNKWPNTSSSNSISSNDNIMKNNTTKHFLQIITANLTLWKWTDQ